MTSSTRQPRGSGSRRRAGRPAPGGAAYPAPRPSRQPMPRQSYRPASAKRPAKPQRRARKPHTIDMPTMCATLLLLLVGVAADRFGLRAAMFASPFSFLCVLLMTRFLQMKKHRNG